jgi:putative Holliday junction resolvase
VNILALDVGEKRIGVACGNTETKIAFTREILHTKTLFGPQHIFQKIYEVAQQEKAEKIIIGHPGCLDEKGSEQASISQKFADELEDSLLHLKSTITVELIDESFSTQMAAQQLQKMGIQEKAQKNQRDSLAAAAFLQTFFDTRDT